MEEKNYTTKLNIIGEKVSHYFYSKFFPIQIALLVALCYIADVAIVGLFIVSILACFIFIFYKDVSPIIPLLLMVVMLCRDYAIFNDVKTYATLIPAIAGFIARPFIHPIKRARPGLLFLPLVFVSFAFALAGILAEDYDFMFGIAYFISLGPTMIIIYFFFSYNIYPRKDFCVKKYLCYSFVATGLAMAIEMFYFRYLTTPPESWKELGWINVNGCAAFLLLSIPACFYLIIKSKKILPLLVCILALYVGMFISGSDAALVISLVYLPFLLIYTYRNIYRDKRKIFAYSVATIVISIATAIIVLVALYGFEGTLQLLQIEPSASGRNEIYQKAIELFKENPIFGYGFQYHEEVESTSIKLYNFHSTLLHVIATMGIFGLIAYGFYFAVRFVILMRSYSPFTMTMLTAFIMYESYAMIDTGEFNAIPLMSAITVMITVVEWATKKGNATSALPLSINKHHGYNF